ncbi:uncharacterized protein LOC131946080 [Physella acuta]|uniref:uncharacterized protein LOC131946080 n=1 Tax=Physella acuta TaxID=109671 RepID=UPI0027DB9FA6|nr:uncharacterized protein LOC131946080 [Physella acuta]
MAESIHMEQDLINKLEQLIQINSKLHNILRKFEKKVKHTITDWKTNPTEGKFNFKELVAMVTTSNAAMLEHIKRISGIKKKLSTSSSKRNPAKSVTEEMAPESQSFDPELMKYAYVSGLDEVDGLIKTALSTLHDTHLQTDEDKPELQQRRDNNVQEPCDIDVKVEKIVSMQSVMLKLLQQRLAPIETLMQKFNQNLTTREQNIKKLEAVEKDVLKLSNDVSTITQEMKSYSGQMSTSHDERSRKQDFIVKNEAQINGSLKEYLKRIETRVRQPYVCQIHLSNNIPVCTGSVISTFHSVGEYYGSQFNRTTGKLVASEDGLYVVDVTLHEQDDKLIKVGVYKGEVVFKDIYVRSANTSACGSTMVYMRQGEELYFKVRKADPGAMLQAASSFTIVRL